MDHWFGVPSWDPGPRTYPTELTTDVEKAAFDDIGSWDVSHVTNMSNLFKFRRTFNEDIGNWDVSNVTTLYRTFYHAEAFNQDIGRWNVSNVTTLKDAFYAAMSFNQSIDSWDVSNVTSIYRTFALAYQFNQSISSWNVSSVTNMVYAFWKASAFDKDLSLWERPGTPTSPASTVRNVTSFYSMFAEATAFNQDLSPWDISGATSLGGMFAQSAMSSKKLQWGPIAEGVVRDAPPYGDIFEGTSGNEITTRRNAAFVYAGLETQGVKNIDNGSEWKAGSGQWTVSGSFGDGGSFEIIDNAAGSLKAAGAPTTGVIIKALFHNETDGEEFHLHIYTLPQPSQSGTQIVSGGTVRVDPGNELSIGVSTFTAHHTLIPAIGEAGTFTAVDSEHTYYKSSNGVWTYAYRWVSEASGYRWVMSDGTWKLVGTTKFEELDGLTFYTATNEWEVMALPMTHVCGITATGTGLLQLTAAGSAQALQQALQLANSIGIRLPSKSFSTSDASQLFDNTQLLPPSSGQTVLENTDYVLRTEAGKVAVITGVSFGGELSTLPAAPAQPGSFLSSIKMDGTATIANTTEAAGPAGCVVQLSYGDPNNLMTYPVPDSVPSGGSSTVQVGVRYIFLVKSPSTMSDALRVNELKIFADGGDAEIDLESESAAGSAALYSSNLATRAEDLTNLYDTHITGNDPDDGSYVDYYAFPEASGGIPPTRYHWSSAETAWVMIDLKKNRNVTKVEAHLSSLLTTLDLYTEEGTLAFSKDLSGDSKTDEWKFITIPSASARLLIPDEDSQLISYRGKLWNESDFSDLESDPAAPPFEPVRVVLYNTSTSMALAHVQVFDGEGALANVSNVVTTGPHKVGGDSNVHLDAISAITYFPAWSANEFHSTGVSFPENLKIHFPSGTEFPTDWLSSGRYFMMHIKHEDVKTGLLMRVGSTTNGTTLEEGVLSIYSAAMYVYSNARQGWYYRHTDLDRQVAIPGVGTSLPGYWTSGGTSVRVARGPDGDWYSFNPTNDQDPVYHFAGSSDDEYPFQNAREGTQVNPADGTTPATATVTSVFGPYFDAAALVGTTNAEVILIELGSSPNSTHRGPDMGDLDAVYTTGGDGTFTLAPVLAEGGTTAWDMRQPSGVAGLDATSPFWSMSARGQDGVLDTISKIRVWTDSDATKLPSRMAVYSSDGYLLEDRLLSLAAGTFNTIDLNNYGQTVKDDALAQPRLKIFASDDLPQGPTPISFGQERYGVDPYYTVGDRTVSTVSPELPGVPIVDDTPHPILVRRARTAIRSSQVTLISGDSSTTYSVGAEPSDLSYLVSADQPLTIRQEPGSLRITLSGELQNEVSLTVSDANDASTLTVQLPEGVDAQEFVGDNIAVNIGEFVVPHTASYVPSARLRITVPVSSPYGSFRAEVGQSQIFGSDAFLLSDGSLVGGQLSAERTAPALESIDWQYGDREGALTVRISSGEVVATDLPSRLVVLKEDGTPLTLSDGEALPADGTVSVFRVKVHTDASVITLALTARLDGGPSVVKAGTVLADDQPLGDPEIPAQIAMVVEEGDQTKLKITGLSDEGTSAENLVASITRSERDANYDSGSVAVNANGEATILYTPPDPVWRVKGDGGWIHGATPPSFTSNPLTEGNYLSEDAATTVTNRPVNEALLAPNCARVALVRIALGESQTASLHKVEVRSIGVTTVESFFANTDLNGDPVDGLAGSTRAEQLVNVLNALRDELNSGSTGILNETNLTSWYAAVNPAETQASLIAHFVTNEEASSEEKWASASAAHSHTVGVGTSEIPAGHYRLVTDAASPTVSVDGEGRWPDLFEIPEVVAAAEDVNIRIEHRVAPCKDGAHSGAVNANACGFDVVVGGVPVATQLRYNRKDDDGKEYGVVRLRVDALEGGGIATTALQDGLWYRATAPWRAGLADETQ